MVVWLRVVELTPILVPNSVLAILSARNDEVVGGVPVTAQYNSVMCFPLNLLVSWKSRDDRQILV